MNQNKIDRARFLVDAGVEDLLTSDSPVTQAVCDGLVRDLLAAETPIDHSMLVEGDDVGWRALIVDMNAGRLLQVPEWVYDYFLNVLPPKGFTPGGFVFCEGEDVPTVFLARGGRYYAMQHEDVEYVRSLLPCKPAAPAAGVKGGVR